MSWIIANQLVKPGILKEDYSGSDRLRIILASIIVYVVTAATALTTTYLYNPDNLFGSNEIVNTPIRSFQSREFKDGCDTLVFLFSADDAGDPFVDQSLPSLPFNFEMIETGYELPEFLDTILSGPVVDTVDLRVDFYPNQTISWNGEVELCKSIVRVLVDEIIALFQTCQEDCSWRDIAVVNYSLPQSCAIVGAGSKGFNVGYVACSSSLGGFGLNFRNSEGNPNSNAFYFGYRFDGTPDTETLVDGLCTETTFGASNLQSLAPFTCSEPQFRGWLEVIALATSNAGLVYATAVVILRTALRHPLRGSQSMKTV